MSKVLRMEHVPESSELLWRLVRPSIVYSDNYFIVSCHHWFVKYLFKFDFADNTWKQLRCENMHRNFSYFTLLIVGHYLVIHGTNDNSLVGGAYSTYIGDLRQNTVIRFEFIGDDVMPPLHEHRVVSDKVNNLYTLTTHWVNGVVNTIIKRLDVTTRTYTVLYATDNQFVRQDPTNFIQPVKKIVIYYDSRLYVFAYRRRVINTDFSNVTVFNLRTNSWYSINLLTTDEPQSSFPVCQPPDSPLSMAQCPTNPRHVYLTLGNRDVHVWDVWRVDLETRVWRKLVCHGPSFVGLTRPATVVTPSGMLYVLRTPSQADYMIQGIHYGFFCATIRVRQLEDMCLDAVVKWIPTVDPNCMSIRSMQNISVWWSKINRRLLEQEQPSHCDDQPAEPVPEAP